MNSPVIAKPVTPKTSYVLLYNVSWQWMKVKSNIIAYFSKHSIAVCTFSTCLGACISLKSAIACTNFSLL
jgi:hypothetical protein